MLARLVVAVVLSSAVAIAAEPDAAGCVDHPLLTRMAGYRIVRCKLVDFDTLEFRDATGREGSVEGRLTEIVYGLPESETGRSTVQVIRNYKTAFETKGGRLVFLKDGALAYLTATKDGRPLWAVVNAYNSADVVLTVVESGAMRQEVEFGAPDSGTAALPWRRRSVQDGLEAQARTIATQTPALLPALGIAPALEPDAEGCADHPLLTRMAGYRIVRCKAVEFDALEFRDSTGREGSVEGRLTEIVYGLPEGGMGRSTVQVVRNYKAAFEMKGGRLVFLKDGALAYLAAASGGKALSAVVNAYNPNDVVLTVVEGDTLRQDVVADLDRLPASTSTTPAPSTPPVARPPPVVTRTPSAAPTELRRPLLASVIAPDGFTAGAGASGTVSLTMPAVGEGVMVTLSSSDPAVAIVPSSVLIPAGSVSERFTITPASRVASGRTNVVATLAGASTSAAVTVFPQVTELAVPAVARAGDAVTVTVGIPMPAPSSGLNVPLWSKGNPSSHDTRPPAVVAIPAGASRASATFTAGQIPADLSLYASYDVWKAGSGSGSSSGPATVPASGCIPPACSMLKVQPAGLWGFADLHAHPASHLAFGANERGQDGLFWGDPGGYWESSDPAVAMPPCDPIFHYKPIDNDPVRLATRMMAVQQIDAMTGWAHGSEGGGSFKSWPSAQSVNHQQMHIKAIRRAYDGGLRLMVASVADNQMLGKLWSKVGTNLLGNQVPPPNSDDELLSAQRQLDFIKKLADINSDWMKVVRSSQEAKAAIQMNKLAVVLGVEMDSLSANQIEELSYTHDVRQVVPIHLANNPSFGGAAVYEDLFNTNNGYLNGGRFFSVVSNPNLTFRLGRPQVLKPVTIPNEVCQGAFWTSIIAPILMLPMGPIGCPPGTGAIMPEDVPADEPAFRSYAYVSGGHANAVGLYDNGASLQRLMAKGLLIDVAHMSQRATGGAITLAKQFGYPLMNSHTALRDATKLAVSERDMPTQQATELGKLGGLLGMGTTGGGALKVLVSEAPQRRLSKSNPKWSALIKVGAADAGRIISRLRLTIVSGADGLRGGNDNCDVVLTDKSGSTTKIENINKGWEWRGDARKTVTLSFAETLAGNLAVMTLVHTQGGKSGFGSDDWDVKEVHLEALLHEADGVANWVTDFAAAFPVMAQRGIALGTDFNGLSPQMPFAADGPSYPLPLPPGAPANATKLPKATLGTREYDFKQDGLAHYGMLPDFLAAARLRPQGEQVVQALYRSADDFVTMWEKVEAAARNVPPP